MANSAAMDSIRHLPAVYVSSYYFPDLGKFVRQALPEANVVELKASKQGLPFSDVGLVIDTEDMRAHGNEVEVLFCDTGLVKGGLDAFPALRWLQAKSAGVNLITKQYCREKRPSFRLTRIPCTGDLVSEYMITYILANEKRVFPMTIESLDEVLATVDYICCCLPGTPDTANMLSGDILKACCQKKPVLINTGRGDLIDEITLVTAIREGWLGGAVLDVNPAEPLPPDSPLWTLQNVLITPHISGYTRDPRHIQRYVDVFVENYRRYCDGQPLMYEVDFEKGY
ncbi:GHRB-like protein [Mya arenaria]|uniref:GHRB-like protein n=1 Tax=Mya arenaria TaxID=6604 RepID=A0ABY7F6F8_MYAAR|nr:GHRB-like protein [Mya arenaria]